MFQRITEHIHMRKCQHYTDRPNIGYIRGERGVLLFDAGNSGANVEQLKKELRDAGLPMPDYLALSHWHWDHSYGAAFWGCPVIAGRETDAWLRRMSKWSWDEDSMARRVETGEDIDFCCDMIRREYPDRMKIKVVAADLIFDGRLTIDLGGVRAELIHCKGPHSSDSVLCYVPEDRFVFLGDSNCKDLYGLSWECDIEVEGSFTAATEALAYDPEKVRDYLALLETLDFTHCASGLSEVKTREHQFASLKEAL